MKKLINFIRKRTKQIWIGLVLVLCSHSIVLLLPFWVTIILLFGLMKFNKNANKNLKKNIYIYIYIYLNNNKKEYTKTEKCPLLKVPLS